jgi:hypothetical protein
MKRRTLAFAAALGSLALPAAADWLVTRDGARVETRGGWRIKGTMVIFSLPNGTLSSLRLSQVDLPASEKATAEAAAPRAAAPPAAAKRPVLVLTDADVRHVTRPPGAGGSGAATAAGEEAPQLEVVSWSQVQNADSLDVQILGTLRNNADTLATDVSVLVRLFDSDQGLLAETPAIVTPASLAPGATTNFRALFPGVGSFVSVTFEAKGNLTGRTLAPPSGG